jgi:hypothetical protein
MRAGASLPAQAALESAQVELVAQIMDAIDDLPPGRSIVIGRSDNEALYVVCSHDRVARAIRDVRTAEGPAGEEWEAEMARVEKVIAEGASW